MTFVVSMVEVVVVAQVLMTTISLAYHSCANEKHGYYKDLFTNPPAFKVGWWARVNINHFINQHEVSFIIEAVKQIGQHGWRHLPHYTSSSLLLLYI
jgi:hypothetical protein